MQYVEGIQLNTETRLADFLAAEAGVELTIVGAVHSVRNMGEIGFVILRRREGLLQTVWEEGVTQKALSEIREGDTVRVSGIVRNEERAPHGKELHLIQDHFRCRLINGN